MAEEQVGNANGDEQALRAEASAKLSSEAKRSILGSLAAGASALGAGAVKLVNAVRGVKDPEEAIQAFDRQLEANRLRREPLARSHEELYARIAAKKKAYVEAPAARKGLLEMELRSLLSQYKSEERQLKIYFENELTINSVRGRTLELVAMGLRQVREKDIDRLTDDIEDAASGAEDVSGALRDLENAGRRREDEASHDAFLDDLAGFDEAAPAPAAESAAPAAGESRTEEPLDLSGF